MGRAQDKVAVVTGGAQGLGEATCTKHAIPYMKWGGGGSIINLSSIYGLVGGLDESSPFIYHACKGAVRLMSKSDALDQVGKQQPEGADAFHRRFLGRVPLATELVIDGGYTAQ